jgi:hypothetical protein
VGQFGREDLSESAGGNLRQWKIADAGLWLYGFANQAIGFS